MPAAVLSSPHICWLGCLLQTGWLQIGCYGLRHELVFISTCLGYNTSYSADNGRVCVCVFAVMPICSELEASIA